MGEARTVVAVISHADVDATARWVADLRAFDDDLTVVGFNSGRDGSHWKGLDVELCPYSRPMEYARISRFHFDTMRWLCECGEPWDVLVTTEPDMALTRQGLPGALSTALDQQRAHYLGAGYWVRAPSEYPAGMTKRKWRRVWQPLLGTDQPSGAMNPGQVFTHRYADELLAFDRLDELLWCIDRTEIHAMCEVVWPTMAVALGLTPAWPPYSEAIRPHRWPLANLTTLLRPHGPHLIHKVGARRHDSDRRLIDAWIAGRTPPEGLSDDYVRGRGTALLVRWYRRAWAIRQAARRE